MALLTTQPTITTPAVYRSRGMGGLLGTTLFDAGLDVTQWGIGEWLITGGLGVLLLGGGMFRRGGSSREHRRKLQLARAEYELARAKA